MQPSLSFIFVLCFCSLFRVNASGMCVRAATVILCIICRPAKAHLPHTLRDEGHKELRTESESKRSWKTQLSAQEAKAKGPVGRSRHGSNPKDFESIALTTRPSQQGTKQAATSHSVEKGFSVLTLGSHSTASFLGLCYLWVKDRVTVTTWKPFARTGTWTLDPQIKSLMLYRLSYPGSWAKQVCYVLYNNRFHTNRPAEAHKELQQIEQRPWKEQLSAQKTKVREQTPPVVGRVRTCAGRPQWISSPSP